MTPTLSIVIPSHSRADLLADCLASVIEHAPRNCEIMVVDDASEDSIVSQTVARFPQVRIIRLEERSGFAVAANVGVVAAQAEIVELLNDDTVVSAGWADAVLPLFERPDIVAVAPLVLQFLAPLSPRGEGVKIDSAGDDYDPGGFAFKRFHGQRLDATTLKVGPVWGAAATAAFYRRRAFLAVGGFEESFGAYFEDVDLSRKLRAADGTIWHQPDSKVWHRVSASYGRRPSDALLKQQSCNEERLFWRTQCYSAIPRHGFVLIAKLLRRLNEGRSLPWLLGRLAATRHWSDDVSETMGAKPNF